MTAIETIYNGYRFRSRLEARWAVFFDAGGIKYEYEPEGVDDGDVKYLPDFYLPEFDLWVEVKPDRPNAREELKKPLQCVIDNKIKRLMILPNVPAPSDCEYWWYPFVYYHNGSQCAEAAKCIITPGNHELLVRTDLFVGYENAKGFYSVDAYNAIRIDLTPINDRTLDYGCDDPLRWTDGEPDVDGITLLHNAYKAARQARFEHGENGSL